MQKLMTRRRRTREVHVTSLLQWGSSSSLSPSSSSSSWRWDRRGSYLCGVGRRIIPSLTLPLKLQLQHTVVITIISVVITAVITAVITVVTTISIMILNRWWSANVEGESNPPASAWRVKVGLVQVLLLSNLFSIYVKIFPITTTTHTQVPGRPPYTTTPSPPSPPSPPPHPSPSPPSSPP